MPDTAIDLPDWQTLQRALPGLTAKLDAYRQTFLQLEQIPPLTLVLCRCRMAQLHGLEAVSQDDLQAGVAQDKLANLGQWPSHDAFSDDERAALAFTEVYTMDPSAITDAHADAVKAAYGEAGLVALIHALGLFYAEIRTRLIWKTP
ncbi:MAG: hypothetical protein V2J89_05650 [Halieaceae bacterium]|jgi:hypothetical protein|nr:hypothetical protein [Halieaceae bacterium]